MKQGLQLQKWIDEKYGRRKQISEILNVAASTVDRLYNKAKLDNDVVEALKKAKLDIPGVTSDATEEGGDEDLTTLKAMQMVVDMQKRIIELQEAAIKELKEAKKGRK